MYHRIIDLFCMCVLNSEGCSEAVADNNCMLVNKLRKTRYLRSMKISKLSDLLEVITSENRRSVNII